MELGSRKGKERERVGLEFGILRDWWSSFHPLSLPLAKEGKGISEPKLCYAMFAKERKKESGFLSSPRFPSLGGKKIYKWIWDHRSFSLVKKLSRMLFVIREHTRGE